MLQPGARIPDLPPLAEHAASGKPLVLYFFPKAGTPACIMEACSFRDNLALLRDQGAEVVGVSPDSATVLSGFASKYSLDFPLLSDAEGTLAEAFGVATQQLWAGKTFQSVSRTTFLFDAEGGLRQVWENVDPRDHVQHVAAATASMAAESSAQDLQARLEEARRIVSPFANAREAEARLDALRRSEGHEVAEHDAPLRAEAGGVDPAEVQGVLDTLRPYMRADGGDVELVGIDAGIVKVRLQGACGTCPSSTVTLRLGIEAQLKQRIPGVQGVEAVF